MNNTFLQKGEPGQTGLQGDPGPTGVPGRRGPPGKDVMTRQLFFN